MSGLEDLRSMDAKGKVTLLRKYLPDIQPGATPKKLEQTYQLMDAASGVRGRSARRGLSGRHLFAARQLLESGWQPIKSMVEEQFKAVGAEGFEEALRSGLVELHPSHASLLKGSSTWEGRVHSGSRRI